MADYYCRICNVRKVANPGDICANCQDPYQQVTPTSENGQSFSDHAATMRSTNSNSGSYDNNEYASDSFSSGKSKRRIMGTTPASAPISNNKSDNMTSPQPIQSTPVIPSTQTTTKNTTSSIAKQKTYVQTPQTEGVVRNIVEGKDPSGFLVRWLRSFVSGTSFPMSDEQAEFQVFSNWQNSNNAQGFAADKVIVYGHMQNNKPVQDNTVRVYGRRNKNNAIIAEVIENTTDGTRTEFQPAPLPALLVKVITLIVLVLIVSLLVLLFSGISGLSKGGSLDFGNIGKSIGNFATNLLLTVIAGLATYYCGSKGIKLLAHGGNGSSIIMYAVGTLVAASTFVSFVSTLF